MRMKKILVLLAVFSGVAALIIKTEEVAQGVGDALILCVNSVIPALFPFFVLSLSQQYCQIKSHLLSVDVLCSVKYNSI